MAETTGTRAAAALLIFRFSLAIFLLQWSIEKFVVPEAAIRIGQNFYGVALTGASAAVLGALETLVALALLFGIYRRLSYGVAALIHGVSVIATWRQLLHPYSAPRTICLWRAFRYSPVLSCCTSFASGTVIPWTVGARRGQNG